MGHYKDLIAYKKGFEVAVSIFDTSKKFPKEEKFSLTDQIRRSSRSVCANFGEAYRRRKYPQHFLSKLYDSYSENTETEIWLDFALACEYIISEEHKVLFAKNDEVGRLLKDIINNPDKYS